MVDFVSKEKRSRIMRGSRSKDTKPELAVRAYLRANSIGYRLHRKDLPGRPDIAMMGRRKAIFVHGCFWHQHLDPSCPISRKPESNTDFWNAKFDANRIRDERNEKNLLGHGFDVLVIWECDVASGAFQAKIDQFLNI